MSTVKINGKAYTVPELNFRHSKLMEQMGLPVEGMVSRKYLFTAVSAFTAITVGCETEQADHLVEQHILGGGDLEGIYKAYLIALNDSAFFKKLLQGNEQEKKAKSNVKAVEDQPVSEE